MRLWHKTSGEPWAMTEQALQTILAIAARNNDSPQAVAAKLGRELNNTHTATERDGVAIIPVVGPLFRYANLFSLISRHLKSRNISYFTIHSTDLSDILSSQRTMTL